MARRARSSSDPDDLTGRSTHAETTTGPLEARADDRTQARVTRSPGQLVPEAALLDTWAGRAWTDGHQIDALPTLHALRVFTRNSVYEIVVLSPELGQVLVRGGRFFPEARRVLLAGCSLGGSFLKVRGLYVGFCMELHAGGQVIVTSPVRDIVEIACETA